MTFQQAKEIYNIPDRVTDIYMEFKGAQCTESSPVKDEDMDCLSLLITLWEAGFEKDQAKEYLQEEKNADGIKRRLRLLNEKRRQILEDIHRREKCIYALDYLRYRVEKSDI